MAHPSVALAKARPHIQWSYARRQQQGCTFRLGGQQLHARSARGGALVSKAVDANNNNDCSSSGDEALQGGDSASQSGRRSLLSSWTLGMLAASAAQYMPPSRTRRFYAHAVEAAPDAQSSQFTVVSGTSVKGERFQEAEFSFDVPSDWTTYLKRKRGKTKTEKFLLYTDTYGPNYRYTEEWPKFGPPGEEVALNKVITVVCSAEGRETMSDYGPVEGIRVASAFGVDIDGLELAEEVSARTREDANGVEYYEWELNIQGEERALISAAVSGGGLYVFAANATTEQYEAFPQEIAHIASSFSVVPTELTTLDQNQMLTRGSISERTARTFSNAKNLSNTI